jgi:Flp pilus assembly protein TadD
MTTNLDRRTGIAISRDTIICVFLVTSILIVYWQALDFPFSNLDDPLYVSENIQVQSGLTLDRILWALTTSHAGFWIPLTWLSYMVDYEIFGPLPGGYHLTNILLHILNTLLLFIVLKKMTGRFWRSSLVAALFALHPLHVESVVWITERKDVLSTFFWLLTIWAYVRYVERPVISRYLPIPLFLILGLMAKPMLVTLPFVLLLLDYWPLGRCRFTAAAAPPGATPATLPFPKMVREKIPLFVIIIAASIALFLIQKTAMSPFDTHPLGFRIQNALVSYIKYISQAIWPSHLGFLYPFPKAFPAWQVAGSAILLISITLSAIAAAKKRPYFIIGWFWYLGTLVPVIGLVQVGHQAMADRFTYIPLIGLYIVFVWTITAVIPLKRRRLVLILIALILLPALTITSRIQAGYWADNETILKHTRDITGDNHFLQLLLGGIRIRQGRHSEAVDLLTASIRQRPDNWEAQYDLALALSNQGKHDEALPHYVRSLAIKPDNPEALNNLGLTMTALGRTDEAVIYYSQALQIEPEHVEALNNLGLALIKSGRTTEAIRHFSRALELKPDFVGAHNNLGIVLMRQGKAAEAVVHYKAALRLEPGLAQLHNNMGKALLELGRTEEAIASFSEALRLNPGYIGARRNLEWIRGKVN